VAGKVLDKLQRKCNTPEQALGAVITELRLRRKWSYQHVSHLVGCSDTYMNGIEHGKRNPAFKILQAIAHVHGIKPSQLLAAAERKYLKARK
jgi:transcriptional regulator with XRE-family HTH domain